MAESVQIAKLTPRHDNIITFLIANPTMKKGDVARVFDVSPAWLSTIINSDIFQAKLRERQDEFFSAATESTREKLSRLADEALDKLIEKVETESDIGEIRQVAAMALDRSGFAAVHPLSRLKGAGGNVQQNFFIGVEKDMLAQARQRIIERSRGETYDAEADKSSMLPAPEGLQAGDRDRMGETFDNPTSVYPADEA